MGELNLVVLIISIAGVLALFAIKHWIYDGCYEDEFSDIIKIILCLVDVFKDVIFVYCVLMYLLYGLK